MLKRKRKHPKYVTATPWHPSPSPRRRGLVAFGRMLWQSHVQGRMTNPNRLHKFAAWDDRRARREFAAELADPTSLKAVVSRAFATP